MVLKTNLESLMTRLGTEFKTVNNKLSGTNTGVLTSLATVDKSHLVAAINEVHGIASGSAGAAITSVNGTAGPGAITIDTDDVGEGAANLYHTNARVIASLMTGYVAAAGTVTATDSVLQAVQKVDGNAQANASAIAALDTDDVAEGANLYFTTARVLATALAGFTTGAGTVTAADTMLQAIQKLDGNINAIDITAVINDAVTAAGSTWSSTKINTEISTAVSAVIDAAPGALNTLNELAAALGDDSNYAATVTGLLATKLELGSATVYTAPQITQGQSNLNVYDKDELGANIHTNDWVALFNAALV